MSGNPFEFSEDDARLPKHKFRLPKKLIVCCDGTWQDSDNGWIKADWPWGAFGAKDHLAIETNVTRIARAIKAEDEDHHPQVVYYQAGVGTGIGLWNHFAGGGTGLGLDAHIREAYSFLASNYAEHDPDKLVPPDSIFLIGFSRGAYTARSIGGLLGAIGLLKKASMPLFQQAFNDWENAGAKQYKPQFFKAYFDRHPNLMRTAPKSKPILDNPESIKKYFDDYREILLSYDLTQEVKINAIGVWDTVGALGVPVNPWLQRVFHLPSYIRQYKWFDTNLDNHIANAFHAIAMDERRFPYSPAIWERREGVKSNLKQVWFPGVHSNVGGGYEDTDCADATLAWMMDQLGATRMQAEHPEDFRHHEWIHFDDEYIDTQYDLLREFYKKQVQEHKGDMRGWARGKIYDSLTFPQSAAGKRVRSPGRYRRTTYSTGIENPNQMLMDTEEYIHASVRLRIEYGGNWYEPDAGEAFPSGWDLKTLFVIIRERFFGGKPSIYNVHKRGGPLEGWQLLDGHENHDRPHMSINMDPGTLKAVQWKYVGDDAMTPKGKVLKEDRLGKFELTLLRKDEKVAEQVARSNNGWHRVQQIVQHAVHRPGTF